MLPTIMSLWIALTATNNAADEQVSTARGRAAVMVDCVVRAAIVPGTPRTIVEAVLGDGVETGWSIEGTIQPGCFQTDVQYCHGRLRVSYTRDAQWRDRVMYAYFRH